MKLTPEAWIEVSELINTGKIKSQEEISISHVRNRGKRRAFSPKGGTTIVTINFSDVGLVTSRSECSELDTYSRYEGRSRAILRVIEAREKKLSKLPK